MVQNKALIFKEIPTSYPVVGVHLVVETHSFDLDQTPPPGGIITKILYCSIDPYMRGRMRDPKVPSYSPAYTVGKPITAYSLVQVLASNQSHYKKGDILFGQFNVEEYSVAPKEVVDWELTRKVDHLPGIPLSSLLSVLGVTGLTAYSALYEIGAPKKGETIFISSAAGAVGHIAGQLAKHEGLHVIGSVGDDQKLAFINQLGFDGGFNYKKEKATSALQRLAPQGVDIYFDNVGGEQLEAAIHAMNNWGRIIACGSVSQSSVPPEERYGVKNLNLVVTKRIKMQGFILSDKDFGPKYFNEFKERIATLFSQGGIKSKEHITEGIDQAGEALVGMLRGDNFGKAILKIADPEQL